MESAKSFFGHWFLSVRGCAVQEVDSVERVIIVLTLEWNANFSFCCRRELNELPINWFTSNVWLKTPGVRVEKLFSFFSRSNVLKLRNFFYRNVNSVNSVSIICPSIFENYEKFNRKIRTKWESFFFSSISGFVFLVFSLRVQTFIEETVCNNRRQLCLNTFELIQFGN